MQRSRILIVCLLSGVLCACSLKPRNVIVVGSKNFTEQVVLGELLAQELEAAGLRVERRFFLGGTYIAHQALLAGRIDMYVEYTGTALTAVLKQPVASDPRAVWETVRREYALRYGLRVLPSLGFENTFAIVMRGDDARRLGVLTLSDAARYAPGWRAGFGYEFLERPDGYTGLAAAYDLQFAAPPRIMDLGLLYRALTERQVDLVAGNSTDGPIAALGLTVLEDDRRYFPPYEAVPIVREETLARFPAVLRAIEFLSGKISALEMRRMNYAVDGEHRHVEEIVGEFRARLPAK